MSDGDTATTVGQDEDLGFRPAMARTSASTAGPDDGLGFRPSQSAVTDDGLGFRPAPTAPERTYSLSDLGLPHRTALQEPNAMEKPYTAVRGLFGEPELSEESKQRAAIGSAPTGSITPGETGPAAYLERVASDIRHGTTDTGPGRLLHGMGAPGTESGVSPTVASVIGGPVEGPVKTLAGATRWAGPLAGEPDDWHNELRGVNETIRGAMQTASIPLAATQPEFLPTMTPYAVAGTGIEKGLRAIGANPDIAELASNAALLAGGTAIGAAAEPRPEFPEATFDRARAVPREAVIGPPQSTPLLTDAEITETSRRLGVPVDEVREAAHLPTDELHQRMRAAQDALATAQRSGKTISEIGRSGVDARADLYQGLAERVPVIRPRAVPTEGDTTTDYLGRVRQRIGDQIAETERQQRINAPVNVPRLPETTERPPIVARPPQRTPMQDLSAQADEVRGARQFREQLTNEIADQIVSRLRDEGLLEPTQPDVRVIDRRAVRPEDVESVQPQRTFIGSENVPPSVVPRGQQLSRLLETQPPARPSADDVELGFRPENASRMLQPASREDLARIEQEQQRYDAALARARGYGQPKPVEMVEPAAPKDITADSRRMANLAVGRFTNPIERQYARDLWSSMIGQSRIPVPPTGMERVRANEIRNGFARISRSDIANRVPDPRTIYPADVLDEARAMMEHTHDFLSQQERPGRYFADMGEDTSLTGRGATLPVTAIKSWRGQFPWFGDLKESPGDLAKALRLGEGPGYDRLITAAAEQIVRSRAETQRMARNVEPDIENLAEQVRTLDPELADFLADAARGNLSTWTETHQQRLATIEGRISDAKAALEFGRAIDDLAAQERAGDESAPSASEAEASAARGETGARTGEAEATRPNENVNPQTRRNEGGFITPELVRDLITGRLTKQAYQTYVAKPVIEKGLGLSDKYAAVEKADPSIAAGLHLLDNAPAYLRAKAARNVHDVISNLSRTQERLFTLMADADSRENLRTNHPDEYRRAMADPAIQEALRKYRPIERDLTAARQRVGGETLDQDYLRRVYDQHVAGIGRSEGSGSGERATTAFDRVIQPQKIQNMSREASAEYHYRNGLHEFGPAFGTKFIATNLRALENQIATDFISKATEIRPGDSQPRAVTYNGEKYYRPDIALEMREAGQKSVRTYDMYDPTSGVKYPQRGQSQYLGPSEVVRALNDHGSERTDQPGAVRRLLQEQTIGFGFGIPHVANILRRVTQSAPLGAANPEAWVRAWKVAFGKELRDRGISGIDDPTFDRLMQQGSITTGEMANLKSYWGGNLNPANWARKLASVGHKVIFEPGSFGGLGGVDQRARLYIADLVKSQNPNLDDAQVARAVNTQLGDYNRKNWNDRQKLVAKFMLFPGWDTSSIKWVIEHPIKTTVPPALLVFAANQALNRLGYNRDEDARDISNIHFGDRSIGLTILRESMARNLARPALNYAQSRLQGESNTRALGEASRGIGQAAAGLTGLLRPDLTAAIDLAMNRESPFGGKELVGKNDYDTPGRVLPNLALEKQAALVVRHAIPPLDRMLDSDESVDFASFAGSNLGFPNFKSGAEQRLKRNAAEAMEVSQTVSRLAKSDQPAARRFVQDPDNAAYALFRNDLDSMSKTLKRLDDAKSAVSSAKNLSAPEKRERVAQIDHAKQNLLRNADGLDRLLFERKQQNRERTESPSGIGSRQIIGRGRPAFIGAQP